MTTNTRTLRDALARCYSSERDARRVAQDAGLNLQRIEFSGSAQSLWFSVLGEAEKSGQIDAVVAIAREEYPNEAAFSGGTSTRVAPAPIENSPVATSAPARRVSPPLQVFLSYAHEDEELKNRLLIFLKPMQREGLIGVWHDRDIMASTDWKDAIDANLERAHVVLLLVSPAFLASDYCYDKEMVRALARHDAGEARVVPIILRPSPWTTSPFHRLQALPSDAKPITQWADRDEALLNVEKGLRRLVQTLTGSPRS